MAAVTTMGDGTEAVTKTEDSTTAANADAEDTSIAVQIGMMETGTGAPETVI